MSRSVTSGPVEVEISCLLRTILFSIFFDNFYNAFFQRKLVHNDGLDSVCQNSFLRYVEMNSVFCSLLRFSMNLTIHLPCFEASAVKAMRPILTREFSFQLILEFCTPPRSQYWKCGILIILSLLLFPLSSWCRGRRTGR